MSTPFPRAPLSTLVDPYGNPLWDSATGALPAVLKGSDIAYDAAAEAVQTEPVASKIQQPVDIQARYQAALDSTSTVLAASAIYTGAWQPCGNYEFVTASMFADQAGTLEIDFSNDGNDADMTLTQAYAASATTSNTIQQRTLAPYCRLVVKNGATAQTALRGYLWGQA